MPQTEIIVLGAGMVGVSTALALAGRGHAVTLVDRRPPGSETSFGNAGIIQAEAVEPYAFPFAPRALLDIVTGRSNDVVYRLGDLAHWLGPALRYAWASRPSYYRSRVVSEYAAMITSATSDHAPLIAASGAEALINRAGFRQAYRSPEALSKAARIARRLSEDYGVQSDLLDGSALAESEPGLKMEMAGAIHWTGSWTCSDPGELVQRYARLFQTRGGQVVRGDAETLDKQGQGWSIQTETGRISSAHAVVCLGPWSAVFLRRFQHRFPMVLKRGYHQHFSTANGPRLPFMDVASGTVMAPMRKGLRILTGAELAALGGRPGLRQISRSIEAAGKLFDLCGAVDQMPWLGTRPCTYNMLPIVGPSDREHGLWFNFGHGHQGFTLGPTTARLLAERHFELPR